MKLDLHYHASFSRQVPVLFAGNKADLLDAWPAEDPDGNTMYTSALDVATFVAPSKPALVMRQFTMIALLFHRESRQLTFSKKHCVIMTLTRT